MTNYLLGILTGILISWFARAFEALRHKEEESDA